MDAQQSQNKHSLLKTIAILFALVFNAAVQYALYMISSWTFVAESLDDVKMLLIATNLIGSAVAGLITAIIVYFVSKKWSYVLLAFLLSIIINIPILKHYLDLISQM